jgi:hypothetical protein
VFSTIPTIVDLPLTFRRERLANQFPVTLQSLMSQETSLELNIFLLFTLVVKGDLARWQKFESGMDVYLGATRDTSLRVVQR